MSSNENKHPHHDHEHGHGHGHGHRHCHRRRHLWKIPVFIGVFIFLKAAVVMLLWNYLAPDLFRGPMLDYPHALGLTVLAKLLVGFGGRPFGGPFGGPRGWRHRMKQRWARLSPEEREKLRDEMRKRYAD